MRVRPDYRIINHGTFFDVNSRAENGIDDFCARLDNTPFADNRIFADESGRGNIGNIPFFNLDIFNFSCKKIVMGAQITLRRSDVAPVITF